MTAPLEQRSIAGEHVLAIVIPAAREARERDDNDLLADAIADLDDYHARCGLAMLAKIHARRTRGGARIVPDDDLIVGLVEAASVTGFVGAWHFADVWETAKVLHALAELARAAVEQVAIEAGALRSVGNTNVSPPRTEAVAHTL